MGAVEHLKTLCCLGLPPESAMIAVTPLLHEIIPHGWTRVLLLEPDATIRSGYAEHPATAAVIREHWQRFVGDPSSLGCFYLPAFRATGIGWTLHLQGRGWMDSAWYREVEAPLDSCWILDAMVGGAGRSFAWVNLTRPRSARRFTVDDVQRLDQVRPWLAHAFRPRPSGDAKEGQDLAGRGGAPVLSGQMILTSDAKIMFGTRTVDHLLTSLDRGNFLRHVLSREQLPAPILELLRQLVGAANGTSQTPPRMHVPTAYGLLVAEAKWLVPAGAMPRDIAKDPKSCLIAVTLELREHAIAHAARILREGGAAPAQVKVGIQLAMGKAKPTIAGELGLRLPTVADLTKKLYQTLDVHNSAELSTRIWLGEQRSESRQSRALGWAIETNAALLGRDGASSGPRWTKPRRPPLTTSQ